MTGTGILGGRFSALNISILPAFRFLPITRTCNIITDINVCPVGRFVLWDSFVPWDVLSGQIYITKQTCTITGTH